MRLYHFTRERERERHMHMIYSLEQLSALGNIFTTLTFRIPYTLYRISFIVAATINRVWLIEYGKWNLVAVICILFITYSHFLTIWLHFVASCECPYSPASLSGAALFSYIWATFVCTPKLFACMTINFIQLPPSLLPLSPRPEIIFALTYNRKLWQQQQQHSWERSERGRT